MDSSRSWSVVALCMVSVYWETILPRFTVNQCFPIRPRPSSLFLYYCIVMPLMNTWNSATASIYVTVVEDMHIWSCYCFVWICLQMRKPFVAKIMFNILIFIYFVSLCFAISLMMQLLQILTVPAFMLQEVLLQSFPWTVWYIYATS